MKLSRCNSYLVTFRPDGSNIVQQLQRAIACFSESIEKNYLLVWKRRSSDSGSHVDSVIQSRVALLDGDNGLNR